MNKISELMVISRKYLRQKKESGDKTRTHTQQMYLFICVNRNTKRENEKLTGYLQSADGNGVGRMGLKPR